VDDRDPTQDLSQAIRELALAGATRTIHRHDAHIAAPRLRATDGTGKVNEADGSL
jgi:hypothetical protein